MPWLESPVISISHIYPNTKLTMSITRQGRHTLAKVSMTSKNRQACTRYVTIIFPFLLKAMLAGDICEFLLQLNLRKNVGPGLDKTQQCAKSSGSAQPLRRFTPPETFKHAGRVNSPWGNLEKSRSQPTI